MIVVQICMLSKRDNPKQETVRAEKVLCKHRLSWVLLIIYVNFFLALQAYMTTLEADIKQSNMDMECFI